MIEVAIVIGGIVMLCYVRSMKLIECETDHSKAKMRKIVFDMLAMIIALPIVYTVSLVEDYVNERRMKRMDNRESMV